MNYLAVSISFVLSCVISPHVRATSIGDDGDGSVVRHSQNFQEELLETSTEEEAPGGDDSPTPMPGDDNANSVKGQEPGKTENDEKPSYTPVVFKVPEGKKKKNGCCVVQ
jgi:hypothetical protein